MGSPLFAQRKAAIVNVNKYLALGLVAGLIGCSEDAPGSEDAPEDLADGAVCAGAVEAFQACLPMLTAAEAAEVQTSCGGWLQELATKRAEAQTRQRAGFAAFEQNFRRNLKRGHGCFLEGASAVEMGFSKFKGAYAELASQLAAFENVDGTYVDLAQVKRSCLSELATPTSCESDFLKGAAATCQQKVESCSDEDNNFSSGDDTCLFAPAWSDKGAWPKFEQCVASSTCGELDSCLQAL